MVNIWSTYGYWYAITGDVSYRTHRHNYDAPGRCFVYQKAHQRCCLEQILQTTVKPALVDNLFYWTESFGPDLPGYYDVCVCVTWI